MRSIQNKNRFAKKEIESNNKQASWQNFQTKATKKLKRGVTGDSQFSTSGIGGRVGVTGSQNRKKGTIGGPRRWDLREGGWFGVVRQEVVAELQA